jgi:hypothetical protein
LNLLNHVTGTIASVALIDNRFQNRNEMQEAIKLWETRLRELSALHRAA